MPGTRGRYEPLDYLAADDASRADDLMAAWCDPDVAAVFCARGGYGVQRMVDLLDWDALAAAGPKVLVGFSDVTALHQAFGARLGASTIHGPVVTSLGVGDDESRAHLRAMLFDPGQAMTLTPEPVEVLVPGGRRGCWSAATSRCSPPTWARGPRSPPRGRSRWSRTSTRTCTGSTGCSPTCSAPGGSTGCAGSRWASSPAAGRRSRAGLVRDRLVPLGVPTLLGVPTGHADRNLAFPTGVPAVLDADRGTLALREPALL